MNRLSVVIFSLTFVFIVIAVAASSLTNDSLLISAPTENEGFVILIDAGHGGEDGGTNSADGTLEKDINLSIAKYLKQMLDVAGYNTIMTREDDNQIGDNSLPTIRQRKVSDIRKRLELTQSNPNCLMISIHQNYYSSPQYSGTQVFYSPSSPESRILAESVQGSVVSLLQKNNNRQIKEIGTNVYLLYNCKVPAIMVECGFMSNVNESEKLKNKDYQQQMAFSIMCGIQKYLEEQNG